MQYLKVLFISKQNLASILALFLFSKTFSMSFEENKGQCKASVLYHAPLAFGDIFFEKSAFTLNLHQLEGIKHKHDLLQEGRSFHSHAYQMVFLNSNPRVYTQGNGKLNHYLNYFKGNDPSQWVSNVAVYETLTYHELYANIDLEVYEMNSHLKYDYRITPGGNPNQIEVAYQFIEKISLNEGNLNIILSNGTITESKPYAYQIIENQIVKVDCEYQIQEHRVRFLFPHGYDSSKTLIIDPSVIFSTYSGSTADNWGFTATYDNLGNAYAGGIAFGTGYPTFGAYQSTFGGDFDLSISKFNPSGTALIYSTYIGGSAGEAPHSMIVDNSGNLVIFGSTSSTNFPTQNAYDNSFNGGAAATNMNGILYDNGSDIFVLKLNSSGNALVGSTYIGGSGNDGISFHSSSLNFNYGDVARGEVYIDANDHIYIASVTNSLNFPTTAGSLAPVYQGGSYDGVALRLNSDLSTLIWSTHIGGLLSDAAYSIKVKDAGYVYITGGTESANFPTTPFSIKPSYSGNIDGFILALNQNNGTLYQGTYLGTSAYDQSFILEIDRHGDIFVVGQTKGNYPIVNATYSQSGSTQFIHKLNDDLSSTLFSSVFGDGNNDTVNISPTAFLVDYCGKIYVSGWGTPYNWNPTSTHGLPTTAGAFQTTTDGEDFYFTVFEPNMSGLNFASFYGGVNSDEHVDGGTSRFDKNGYIYQAICANCGGLSNTFPTTPGVYSNTNNSPNCNLALLKIKFDPNYVEAIGHLTPNALSCTAPFTVNFSQTSVNSISHIWNFGDGSQLSNVPSPTHTYTQPGLYNITYISSNPLSCNVSDTNVLQVYIPEPMHIDTSTIPVGCFGDLTGAAYLNVSGGDEPYSYVWTVVGVHGDSLVGVPAGTYYAIVTDSNGCKDSAVVNVRPGNTLFPTITGNNHVCPGDTIILTASSPGNPDYVWNTGSTDPSITVIASSSGTYTVTVTSGACTGSAQFTSTLNPFPVADFDTLRSETQWTFSDSSMGASSWHWDFGDGSTSTEENPTHTYPIAHEYEVMLAVMNNFGCVDTIIKTFLFELQENIIIPNVFTPNKDGVNDYFTVKAIGLKDYELVIYNRWGTELFRSNASPLVWDGHTSGGGEAPHGTYYYLLKAIGKEDYSQTGHITLLR